MPIKENIKDVYYNKWVSLIFVYSLWGIPINLILCHFFHDYPVSDGWETYIVILTCFASFYPFASIIFDFLDTRQIDWEIKKRLGVNKYKNESEYFKKLMEILDERESF